ncbi:MAG: hypothetical protein CMB80_01630, partial [Flammeovirgaceae bacterium]|nr:hypothetical protein [Flammeovirgaceae bacterium]
QVGGMLGDVIGMQWGGSSGSSGSSGWSGISDWFSDQTPSSTPAPSYGGYQAPETDFGSLYDFYGMEPTKAQKEQFEKQYAYDPSRETPFFEDYRAGLETGREAAGVESGQAREAAGQMGRGFAGAGTRGTAVQKSQESLLAGVEEQRRQAQSTLGQQLRGEKEDWMTAAGAGLSSLQQAEGTKQAGFADPHESTFEPLGNEPNKPPENPSHGQIWNPYVGALSTLPIFWNADTNHWQSAPV